ncbi:basic blue protein [Brachypodium distachyon]|uniref:Phytocyanin domain-containing protein n=1 Tax=Brachypodium distachyon TaxID=15368 RepID=I1H3F2_BRADI|nr:basic blue protein [Brachypodium distachyon]KQK20741.1 hypothetical protein BRADI_1g56570v3 [Brachypodium distachyon]|eukprot:XP_003561388.1 basic blue protein [Brachypodium distachyon]
MASRQAVVLLAAAAIAVSFFSAPASAEVFMVGGDPGWTLPYPADWTEGKTFAVGDSLMFMYSPGKHTVVELGGPAFRACNVTDSNSLGSWTTGSDTVALDKPGKRWFVCGVQDHCAKGMKLVVNVGAPGPDAPPKSSASFVAGAVSAAAAGVVAAAALMF